MVDLKRNIDGILRKVGIVLCLLCDPLHPVDIRRSAPRPRGPYLLREIDIRLVELDVFGFNDRTALVDENTALYADRLDLLFQHVRVDQDPRTDKEACIREDKPGGKHPDAVFLLFDLNGVARVRSDTAAGYYCRFIFMGNMGDDLALSLIPKKSTDYDSAAHSSIM